MIDNLRRSLVAPASFALLIAAFALPEIDIWPWLTLIFAGFIIPELMGFFVEMSGLFKKTSLRQNFLLALDDLKTGLHRFCLHMALLPHTTVVHTDAICRALYRLLVSHKKMLEWTAAAHVQSTVNLSLRFFLNAYRRDFVLIILSFIFVQSLHSEALWWSLPFFLFWLMAPVIARQASSPPKPKLIRPLNYL